MFRLVLDGSCSTCLPSCSASAVRFYRICFDLHRIAVECERS